MKSLVIRKSLAIVESIIRELFLKDRARLPIYFFWKIRMLPALINNKKRLWKTSVYKCEERSPSQPRLRELLAIRKSSAIWSLSSIANKSATFLLFICVISLAIYKVLWEATEFFLASYLITIADSLK
jgi:hypothetical protein